MGWQIITQFRWNRKKSAQDLINQLHQGDLLKVKNYIDRYFNPPDFPDKNHEEILKISKEEKEELDKNLKIYLNYLEGIAVGVKHKIYDEKQLYDYIGYLLPVIVGWAKPFIAKKRKEADDETIYIEVEKLAEKWKIRNEKENPKKR